MLLDVGLHKGMGGSRCKGQDMEVHIIGQVGGQEVLHLHILHVIEMEHLQIRLIAEADLRLPYPFCRNIPLLVEDRPHRLLAGAAEFHTGSCRGIEVIAGPHRMLFPAGPDSTGALQHIEEHLNALLPSEGTAGAVAGLGSDQILYKTGAVLRRGNDAHPAVFNARNHIVDQSLRWDHNILSGADHRPGGQNIARVTHGYSPPVCLFFYSLAIISSMVGMSIMVLARWASSTFISRSSRK